MNGSGLVFYLAVQRVRNDHARGRDLIEAAHHAAEAFGVSAKMLLGLAAAAIEARAVARMALAYGAQLPEGDDLDEMDEIAPPPRRGRPRKNSAMGACHD
jgi:hypothetical protein